MELTIWKEVDEKESDAVLEETFLKDYGNTKIASSRKRFVKKIIIRILSEQEIEMMASGAYHPKSYEEGCKAIQGKLEQRL